MTALTFFSSLTTARSGADVSERNLRGSRRRFMRVRPAVGIPTMAPVALFCLLYPAICAKGRPASPPMAVCNLGVLAPGQKILQVIDVRNPFHQPFRVRGVYSTCGCTSGKLLTPPGSEIAPEAHCMLRLDIAARVWPGPEAVEVTIAGTVGRSAEVLRYLVKYEVRNLIRFPGINYYVDLGNVAESSLPQWRVLRIRRGGNPTPWDEVRCTALSRSIEAHLGRPHDRDYLVRLRLARTPSLGMKTCTLRFSFFDRGRKLRYYVDRPVVFRVVGPVDLVPESILFGAVPRGKAVSESLHLFVRAGSQADPYRIVSLRVPRGSPIIARIVTSGRAARITLKTTRAPAHVTGHVEVVISNRHSLYRFREDYMALVIGTHGEPPATCERK